MNLACHFRSPKYLLAANNLLKPFILFLVLLYNILSSVTIQAQEKFDPDQLEEPRKYGEQVAALLNTQETPVYADSIKNVIYLKNGFKAAGFVNPASWLQLKDSVIPYRIDIVYSKYPLKNGEYREIYPLLFSRLQNLFDLDPDLNDAHIEWNKVLQTNCLNDDQVDGLFHGVVIWYESLEEEEEPLIHAENNSAQNSEPTVNQIRSYQTEQGDYSDLLESVDQIREQKIIPDSLRTKLANRDLEDQIETIKIYLQKSMDTMPDVNLRKVSDAEIREYKEQVDDFLRRFPPRDSVVDRVFDRHPEWRDVLVVNDWTGSMYGYGAEVLRWHLEHFEKSGIISMTLFNDGDKRKIKPVGNTGGIYTEKADNAEELVRLYNYVMLQGNGGDLPENNIEGILKAMETRPDFKEIVLIADNNACIRDIALSDRIGVPIRVIVCGYTRERGLNPDLVYLSKVTGGGIYTIEDDIENLEAEINKIGTLLSVTDQRFRVMNRMCSSPSLLLADSLIIRDYAWARKHLRRTKALAIPNKSIAVVPSRVFRMRHLEFLDLSHNNITGVNPDIDHLQVLRTLNLAHNRINILPLEFKTLRYLEQLDLSNNQFLILPRGVTGLKYLKILDLSYNQIRKFDRNFSANQLETLSLSHNYLTEVTRSIATLRNLKKLDLSYNQLEKLPDNLTALAQLESMDLSFNRLTALPAQLYKFKKLKTLNLQGNYISEDEKARILKQLPTTLVNF